VEFIYTAPDGDHDDGVAEKYQFRVPITLNESGKTKVPLISISQARVDAAEKADPENPDYTEAFIARQAVIDLEDNSVVFVNDFERVTVGYTD
jgi:hypothetical protein